MVDIIDGTGGEVIIRRPDGSVYLRTSDRNAASLHRVSYTGVTLTWPPFSNESVFTSGPNVDFRYNSPDTDDTFSVVLGALPVGLVPNFMLANIKGTRTSGGNILNNVLVVYPIFPQGQWVPMIGSVWMERVQSNATGYIAANRHMSLGVESGDLVLKCKQSNAAATTGLSPYSNGSLSSFTEWSIDLNVDCGIFDL